MIFQHTWWWVADKSPNTKTLKTQTRRLSKSSDRVHFKTAIHCEGNKTTVGVSSEYERVGMYEVGKTYVVQPGRGRRAVFWREQNGEVVVAGSALKHWSRKAMKANGWIELRIRILSIKREDVRNISNEDVRAEGYAHARDFLHVWASMHDPAIERGTWGEKKLMERPVERYDAWVFQFEVVKP